jgi:hypothetical protein
MTDYNNKKIYIFLHVVSDGSGDFSFGVKLINNLYNIGINKTNINIIINIDENTFITFNNFYHHISTENQQIINENKNEQICLNKDDSSNIKKILEYICTIYKHMHGNKNFDCEKKIDFSNENNNNLTNTYNFIKIDDKNFTNMYEKDFVKDIFNIIKNTNTQISNNKNLCEGLMIDKNILLKFYNDFINNVTYSIWILNLLKFFLLSSTLNESNFIFVNNGLENITPTQLNIKENEDKNNILLISFLCKDCFAYFNNYKFIKLHEGGNANKNTKIYASGFNDDPYNLGINIIDENNLNEQILNNLNNLSNLSELINIDKKYYVCYFGSITDIIYVANCVMLFKLRYFIEKIIKINNNDDDEQIYIPFKCFEFIRKYITFSTDVFKNKLSNEFKINLINNPNVTTCIKLIYNNKNINLCYFKSLSNADFMTFLKYSNKLCILTGDQSFFEGVSMGKCVIYDLLSHKIKLYVHFLTYVFNYYILNNKNKSVHINNIFQNQINEHIELIINNIKPSEICNCYLNELDFNKIEHDINSNTLIYHGDEYNDEYKFTYDPYNDEILCSLLGSSHEFTFNYHDFEKMYELNYILCNNIMYKECIDNLKKNYNYDEKLKKLIEIKLIEEIKIL